MLKWNQLYVHLIPQTTVDGRNPAPVDMVNITFIYKALAPSKRWLFGISSINSTIGFPYRPPKKLETVHMILGSQAGVRLFHSCAFREAKTRPGNLDHWGRVWEMEPGTWSELWRRIPMNKYEQRIYAKIKWNKLTWYLNYQQHVFTDDKSEYWPHMFL